MTALQLHIMPAFITMQWLVAISYVSTLPVAQDALQDPQRGRAFVQSGHLALLIQGNPALAAVLQPYLQQYQR
jgi:hypothetical protein